MIIDRLRRPWPLTPAQIGLLAVLLGGLFFAPGSLKFKLDFLGFGVCHQLSSHSLFIAGHQLPLCARCSGIYLGALITLGMLLILRPLAGALPARRMLPLLGFMFATMVLDGINSTFQSVPGATALYETTNWLRLITGTLAGTALMFVLYPIFNQSFWRTRLLQRERSLEQPYELFGFLVPSAVVVGVLLSAAGDPTIGDWLYWPLALGSVAGLLAMLMMANVLIVSTLSRRAGTITSWQAALTPLLIALLLALIELTVLANLRIALTASLATAATPPDLPLVPGLK
ncbi:MAG TPA: DUF2085 domain-containing protein [Chloroflexia bacterium]|nr:DUF2085 domain-containing protein [Chloroflexia bacterium]